MLCPHPCPSPGSASQPVTVPQGGAGDAKCYAQAITYGYLEICKSSANGVTGTFSFTSLAGGGGINYLSGSFTSTFVGSIGGSTAGLTGSTSVGHLAASFSAPAARRKSAGHPPSGRT